MIRRLRIQFAGIVMALLTILLGCIFGLNYYFTKQSLEKESLDLMQSLSESPFQLERLDEASKHVKLPYCMLQIGSRGELLAANSGYYDLSDREFLKELIETALASEADSGTIPAYNLRYGRYYSPGGVRLVFVDTSSEQASLRTLLRSSLLIGTASLLLLFGMSVLLARRMVKPVEQAWRQQKQFVADASHELKTPLTVIMTNAELLQSPDYAPEAKEQFSANILTMSRQMRGLVESLLNLARIDQGQKQPEFTTVDLSRLTEEAALPFEAVFFEKDLTLETEITPGLAVHGSTSQLRQVVEILLDNAQKYAAAPGWVRVSLRRQGRHVRLAVADTGAPLSEEELKNIFKRFYRLDTARSRDGSFGLGLSIAQSIITAHHGKIWAESSGGVNTFFAELPAAAQQLPPG